MAFLGVDQSLNGTGLSLVSDDAGVPQLATIKQDVDGDAKLLHIRRTLDSMLSGVVFAAMEGYSYHSTNRSFVLGEVGGTVKVLLLERVIPYVVVPPMVLKLFATGSAHALKDEMIVAAQAHGATPADDNQADAFHLARLARAFHVGDAKKRCELEAIHSLRRSISGKQDKPTRRTRRFVKNAI